MKVKNAVPLGPAGDGNAAKGSLALYSLSNPDAELMRRAEILELRRREAIDRLADRWVGKPSNSWSGS